MQCGTMKVMAKFKETCWEGNYFKSNFNHFSLYYSMQLWHYVITSLPGLELRRYGLP